MEGTMDTTVAVAADAASADKEEHSQSNFLSPKSFLEAVRCLNAALHKRLDKAEEEVTPTRPRSGLRSAMGTRTPTVHSDTGQVIVNIRVLFMSINSIDTIKDNYSAEILLQSSWPEPKLDSKRHVDADDNIDWSKYWNPKIIVDNIFGGEPADTGNIIVKRDARTGRATVFETRLIKGRFYELMELYQFPFDVQFLTVVLTSDLDSSEIKMIANVDDPSAIGISAFCAEQEWKLRKDVTTWSSSKVRTSNNNKKTRHPVFSAAVTISRRPQFFIWNIITMMFLTCSLSFATFTVTLVRPESRLQLTFLLLLTTVTFKFAVNKILPKIPYLTFLDKYILGSLIIQFGICVWHAIVGSVIQDHYLPDPISTTSNSSANATYKYYNSTVTTTTAPTTTTAIPPATQKAIIADWIALGSLGGFYIVFQLVFLALIGTNTKKFIVQSGDEQNGAK